MNVFAINTDDDKILESKHLAFFVTETHLNEGIELNLMEIVSNTYNHPDAPDYAKISVIETKRIKTTKENELDAGPLKVCRATDETLTELFNDSQVIVYFPDENGDFKVMNSQKRFVFSGGLDECKQFVKNI